MQPHQSAFDSHADIPALAPWGAHGAAEGPFSSFRKIPALQAKQTRALRAMKLCLMKYRTPPPRSIFPGVRCNTHIFTPISPLMQVFSAIRSSLATQ